MSKRNVVNEAFRTTLVLVGLSLIAVPSVVGHHATIPDDSLHADLAITDVTPSILVLDKENLIRVSVRNNGPEDANTAVLLGWYDAAQAGAIVPGQLIGAAPLQLPKNEVRTATFTWTGREVGGSERIGSVGLFAQLVVTSETDPAPTNNVRAKVVFVNKYDFSVAFPTGQDEAAVRPGTPKTFRFDVRNLGNADDTVRFSVGDPAAGWTYAFQQTDMLIRPGPAGSPPVLTNRISVTPPPNARWLDEEEPVVIATSVGNSAVTRTATGPVVVVDRVLGVQLSRPPAGSGRPQETVTFEVQVKNSGNSEDVFQLGADSPGADWSVSFSGIEADGTVRIPAGQSRTAFVDVAIPPNEVIGEQFVPLRVASVNGAASDTVTLRVRILQRFQLRLDLDNPTVDTEPNKPVQAQMQIQNMGNGPDVVQPELEAAPTGWQVTFDKQTQQLPAGGAAVVKATILPRPGQPAGQQTVVLRVRSAVDPFTSDSQEVFVQVAPAYGVDLLADDKTRSIMESEQVHFDLEAVNAGNLNDKVLLSIDAPTDASPPANKWAWTLSESSIELPPGGRRTVQVSVRAPTDEAIDSQDHLKLVVRAKSDADAARVRTVQVNVTAKLPDLVVEFFAVGPERIYKGEEGTLVVVVRNNGEKDVKDTFDVSPTIQRVSNGVPTGASTPVGAAKLVSGLAAGESAEISFTLPTSGLEGNYRVFARVDKDARVIESDEAGTTGPAANNQKATDIVVRRLGLKVLAPNPLKGETGDVVRFVNASSFRIKNDGTHSEQLEIAVSAAPAWEAAVQPPIVVLDPGQELPVSASVRIPESVTDASSSVISVTAHVMGRSNLQVTGASRVDLTDKSAPVIGSFGVLPSDFKVGSPVTFTGNVTDNVGLAQVSAIVRAPDGKRSLLPMTLVGGLEYRVGTVFARPGLYQFHVEATDQQGNTATGAPAVNFTLERTGSVSIQALGWQDGVRLRAGTSLQLSVSATGGVTESSYSIDGLPYLFVGANPYPIATHGLKEGPHAVEVRFVSLTAAELEANYTIQVDNTAPKVEGIRMIPEHPNVGDTVRLFVTASPDAAHVKILVQGAAGRLAEHAADPSGTGEFFASFRAEAATLSVRIALEDDVGNSATVVPQALVGLLEVENKGSSPGTMVGGFFVGAVAALLFARLRWKK